MPLSRGDLVEEHDVLALAGDDIHRHAAAGATIVLGDSGSLIIAQAADSPTSSCVWNDSHFRLLRGSDSPLPSELLDRSRTALPIHLVVRISSGGVYLGPVVHRMSSQANGELEFCHLEFESPLGHELLDRVRPLVAGPDVPEPDWLPLVDADRGSALETFIDGWYGRPDPEAGELPPVPDSVPRALARLYRHSHGRPERYGQPVVLGIQNYILPIDKLHTDPSSGSLVFGSENQGGFTWTLDQRMADPTVWTVEDTEAVPEPEPLSGFLIQFSLFEAAMTAPYSAFLRHQPEEHVNRLTSLWTEVPLKPAQWYGRETRFHVAPGLIAHVSPDWDDGYEVCIGTKRRGVLRALRELGLTWDMFDG